MPPIHWGEDVTVVRGKYRIKGTYWDKGDKQHTLNLIVSGADQHVNFSTSFKEGEFTKVKKDVDRVIKKLIV